MNNQSQSYDRVLKDISDVSMKKGKFPLLGCLSIILVFGILSAIALPSSLCQANKAKESEPKQYVGSMNRAQQAKFAENGTFANSVDELELGIKTQTRNFRYSVNVTNNAAFSYGIPNRDTSKNAYFNWNEKVEARSYVGAVFLVTHNYTKETSSVAISCVTKSPTKTNPLILSLTIVIPLALMAQTQ